MGAGFTPPPALYGRRLSSHTLTSLPTGGFGPQGPKPKSRIHQSLILVTQSELQYKREMRWTRHVFHNDCCWPIARVGHG
jgi:hypothetical protein